MENLRRCGEAVRRWWILSGIPEGWTKREQSAWVAVAGVGVVMLTGWRWGWLLLVVGAYQIVRSVLAGEDD